MGIPPKVLSERNLRRACTVTTFVTIGNATQPFGRLLDAVTAHAQGWPQPVIVQHGNTPFDSAHCVSRAFLEMLEFSGLVEQTRLLIMHAGAGSILHAIRMGKVPVVMPRRAMYGEIVDDHQLEFAKALADMGMLILAEEPRDLPRAVVEALAKPAQPKREIHTPRIVGLVGNLLKRYASQ
jgi:UDP-N-acetylglucosamine transferase subunit ALG13